MQAPSGPTPRYPCMHPARTLVTTTSPAANLMQEAVAGDHIIAIFATIVWNLSTLSTPVAGHAATRNDTKLNKRDLHWTCLKRSSRRCHSSRLSQHQAPLWSRSLTTAQLHMCGVHLVIAVDCLHGGAGGHLHCCFLSPNHQHNIL